jgi:DNA polymerase-3 subunit delta'
MDISNIIGQDTAVASLNNMIKRKMIPHALLFTGNTGYGSLSLAINFAKSILSENVKSENIDAFHRKIDQFTHSDLHLFFPINVTQEVKSKPQKNDFIEDWRKFIKDTPYKELSYWFRYIGLQNRQGIINVSQAKDIVDALKYKPYEASSKVAIIWGLEYMNIEASNKLLKLIEEPPVNSYLILISENKDRLLPTILSRCQELPVKPLSPQLIVDYLTRQFNIDDLHANHIAEQSNQSLAKAINLVNANDQDSNYEKRIIEWVRYAFMATKKKSAIESLINWSVDLSREKVDYQKNFLQFCLLFFRQAYLNNKGLSNLVYFESKVSGFSFDKFSAFIHDNNYPEIINKLSESILHLERNINTRNIFTNTSFQLTKLLHKN